MNANGRELIKKELTFRVVGYAMAVLNALGHGLPEKTYERDLCVEVTRSCKLNLFSISVHLRLFAVGVFDDRLA